MRLVYARLENVDGNAANGVVLTSPRDGRPTRLNAEEFALARLLDGARGISEALDQFWREQRRRLSPEGVAELLRKLDAGGLLA